MSRYLETVRAIVAEAGHLAMELRAQGLEHHIKPDGTPVTNADLAVSEFLMDELLAAFPDTKAISEESADRSAIDHALTWVIDPIDGTKKYLAGKDVWCVMVALVDTEPLFSLMYYPDAGVWYWAERGLGAWMEDANGKQRLHISPPHTPPRIQYGPECAVHIGELTSRGYMKHTRRLLWNRLDVYLRSAVAYWDVLPPMLLIMEAGGTVVGFDSAPLRFTSPDCVARDIVSGHPLAVADVLKQIKR